MPGPANSKAKGYIWGNQRSRSINNVLKGTKCLTLAIIPMILLIFHVM